MSAESEMNKQLLMAIGELKGSIDGLKSMVSENNTSLNRRIDDLNASVSARLDKQDADINELRTTQTQMMMKSSLSGGAAGGLVVALAELMKLLN